jgi:hypothetical protein
MSMPLMHLFYVIDILESSIINDPVLLASIVMDKKESTKLNVIDETYVADDIIQYIMDTFSWVPNVVANNCGLNYHGVTLFPSSSCQALKSIILGWISIFSTCQSSVTLRGNYYTHAGVWGYERLMFKKEDILSPLQNLLKLIDQMQEHLFFLHLGI